MRFSNTAVQAYVPLEVFDHVAIALLVALKQGLGVVPRQTGQPGQGHPGEAGQTRSETKGKQ